MKDVFNPCEYIPQLQLALNYTSVGSDNVTSFANLVILLEGSSLYTQLQALWGNQTRFSGKFLLDNFGDVTVSWPSFHCVLVNFVNLTFAILRVIIQARRFISFIKIYFHGTAESSKRRQLAIDGRKSESVKRGSVVKKVRRVLNVPLDIHRTLNTNVNNEPIIIFALSKDLSISLDFNFGDGKKELLFGLHFLFQSGNEAEGSIQNMTKLFLQDTIGNQGASTLSGFSFAEKADKVVEDLINSLVIGIDVDIDIQFGLDLTNVFNRTAQSRLPSPFLQLTTFDVGGYIGFSEWSTALTIDDDTRLLITEASALININAGIIGNKPLLLKSATDFLSIISPTSLNGIGECCISKSLYNIYLVTDLLRCFVCTGLHASFSVKLPIFVSVEGIGAGATIMYEDDNIIDSITQTPIFEADIMISIDMIKDGAWALRNKTYPLSDYVPLQQQIPLLKVSMNDLIAGQGRTLADCFDLTEFTSNLLGKQSATEMPTSSPSASTFLSSAPSTSPSELPAAHNSTRAPTRFPSAIPTSVPTSVKPTALPSTKPTQSDNPDYIRLTELVHKMRVAFQDVIQPGTPPYFLPSFPDSNIFQVIRPGGAICDGSDRAISIDIVATDHDGLSITICALLEFEIVDRYDATGLLSSVVDSIDLDIMGEFTLKGALMFGAQLSVSSLINDGPIRADVIFDPILMQFAVMSDLDASVSFGMLQVDGKGKVDLRERAEFAYCTSCNGTYSNEATSTPTSRLTSIPTTLMSTSGSLTPSRRPTFKPTTRPTRPPTLKPTT